MNAVEWKDSVFSLNSLFRLLSLIGFSSDIADLFSERPFSSDAALFFSVSPDLTRLQTNYAPKPALPGLAAETF